jgi:hypothetical protein
MSNVLLELMSPCNRDHDTGRQLGHDTGRQLGHDTGRQLDHNTGRQLYTYNIEKPEHISKI